MKLIYPDHLNAGDKVAIVSLSWGGPATFPYRYEIGKKRLENIFKLEVLPSKHALKEADWIYRHPQARAEDLMNAFEDSSIKAIFSSIGGDDAIRLLPFVDLNIIRKNPKIFLGFSDSTIIHFMCFSAGLTSFYGPAVMTAFAENIDMHDYTIQAVKQLLFEPKITPLKIPYNTEGWTNAFLDWQNPNHQKIKRTLEKPVPWHFLGDVKNIVKGHLLGGCLEVLQFMIGTSLWPSLALWKDSILFLETSEEGLEPIGLIRFLRNLAAQGILSIIKGLLFSKPGGYQITSDCFIKYEKAIFQVFEEYQIPEITIVTQMDFGHTDPMWILPYGANIEINPLKKTLTLFQ